jgi:hypothetical protein
MPRRSRNDPVRAEVEQWLRAFVGAGLAVPRAAAGAAAGTVRRCVGGRLGDVTNRVAEPMRLVRSLVELATGAPPAGGSQGRSAESAPPTDAESTSSDDAPDDAVHLPIDEYESLAASHVVARLDNLTPSELRQVRRFEAAHRGRRTVIGRIDQLLGGATPA